MPLTLKARPEDFVVEEVLRSRPGPTGDYAVYRVTKRLLTTPQAQERIARQLGVAPRALAFPALKDRVAIATQHFTMKGRGPNEISGEGYTARFVGRLPRHLAPSDLAGNRFAIALRGLAAGEATAIGARVQEMARHGLPNYFDKQRFGSYTPRGAFIGMAILQGDAEGALRIYLAQPAPGDPPEVRAFKVFAGHRWGDWFALYEKAPRSNYRSVVTFLKDHPSDFRKALNLITPRLLPLLVQAYQSFLWNRIASRFLQRRLGNPPAAIQVAGETLGVYRAMADPLLAELRALSVPLPHHRAAYAPPDLAQTAERVLAEEGLALPDMKARLLVRAYLPRGARPLLLFPAEARADTTSDRGAVRLSFFLPPGSYATLVVKALAATDAPSVRTL